MTETNIRDFSGNWTGTGTIENAGVVDTERVALTAGQAMISETVNTGVLTVSLAMNVYRAGDAVTLQYRHGATQVSCEAAGWNAYTVPFVSLGYVQARISA